MLVMVVFFIAFRWIHLSTPLIRLFLLVLILLLMPTLNFLPVWFALSLLRFRLPSRLPMMFILWMVAMMVVIIPSRTQSVRFQTALASIKLIQASAVLDLTEDDLDFLTSNKVWIATDRSRARRCVEACVYGTLDFVGYPRFPAPVEFIAAVIAYYVHPVNIQTACLIMEGAEFTENIINGVERPVKAAELFAFTLRVRAGNTDVLTDAEENVRQKLRAEGVM